MTGDRPRGYGRANGGGAGAAAGPLRAARWRATMC